MSKICGTIAGLAGALLPLATSAVAQPYADGPAAWHYGWSWGHMIFGMLMMILFWGGVIAAIVLLVRWIGSGPSSGGPAMPSQNRALDILKERFARGEIDREEFEERKRVLID